ncbi:MAG: response regulator transcription factor [Myxococcota bacterium]|nr:response regulator transcription factor [Myxococcota bacterium]
MAVLLLVEDDDTLGMTLEVSLNGFGHETHWCRSLQSARAALATHPPDLVLLDLGLPDGDGLDLCRELRASGSIIPIVVLTAQGTLHARVDGLTAGADDYVTKPFELPELLARIEAQLRRERWHGPGERARIGRLEIDWQRRQAWQDGEPIALTELELRLLRYLMERAEQVVSREELLARVWQQDPSTRTRTVDVFMARLRRYIEVDTAAPEYLLNVRGVGYRLHASESAQS